MATVRFSHVKKVYANGFCAVSDFNLDIRDKEFVILVGPSGCGKSTTMRMVAGLEDVSDGTVEIGGRVVNNVPSKDRNVAMVFQDYALYPHMTVEENMSLGLRLKKLPKEQIKKTVAEAAEVLDLTPYLDRYPRQLSGGQRQRVALGRAIVRTPDVFMFDEPLSNLDPKLRTTMRVEIKKLHQRLNCTMIYVTHDQIEAMTLGDKIVVLDKGVIQQVDDPISLYDRPRNKFVAGFIGSPPMNFFGCELEESNGAFFAKNAHFRLRLPEREGLVAALKRGVPGAPNICLGIRAEDMELCADGGSGDDRIRAIVDVVEPLGAEALLHVCAGEGTAAQSFVVRDVSAASARLSPRAVVSIKVNRNKMHVFDAVNEQAVA